MQTNIDNVDIAREQFADAVSIYIHKPHVVNKRVTTVRFALALERSVRQYVTTRTMIIDRRTLISKNTRIYHDQDEFVLTDEFFVEFRPIAIESTLKSCGIQRAVYRLQYVVDEKRLRLTVIDEQIGKESLWLKDVLLTKIDRWCRTSVSNTCEPTTLKLIAIEHYQHEYERLKVKYGKYLTSNWCETTDPQKHVFEDLGKFDETNSEENIDGLTPVCHHGLDDALVPFRYSELFADLLAAIFVDV
jgi:hypothetical protein